jgi:hypothetical protein
MEKHSMVSVILINLLEECKASSGERHLCVALGLLNTESKGFYFIKRHSNDTEKLLSERGIHENFDNDAMADF